MSKFFVTNNSTWFNKLKENIINTPYHINGEFETDGFYGLSTRKLNIRNHNFLKMDNDIIIQTGTCVYKEENGIRALNLALNDFDGDVQSHREQYLGNFGCFIKKGKHIIAFCDAAGFYDIFYYTSESGWIIGTSIIDMARILKDYISINKTNVLEELTRYAIFNNETYFNEIYRLSGDQCLSINSNKLTIRNLDLKINQENTQDYENRVKSISKDMKYIAKVMNKNFGQATLQCTGGFDSRMTLAAFLSAGIKPNISYGYGNSYIAESRMGDVEVNKEYCNRYGLLFKLAPWNETNPIDKNWDEHIEKYGKLIYDGCEDAYNYHTKKDERFLLFGYISEIYRESEWSKDIDNDKMTLEDYLWKCHAITTNLNLIKKNSQLTNQWLRKWNKLNMEHGIVENFFKKEELFWILLSYYQNAHNCMVNLVNQYKYAYYLMSDIRILRNGYVNFEKKYNGQFMISILNEIYPDILNVPFFSRCKKSKYNPHLMQVEDLRTTTIKNKIKSVIRTILPPSIKSYINKTLHRGVEGSSYINEVASILNKDGNEDKLRRLIGDEVFNNIDLRLNHIFVLRGIILCKTFDFIGVKY